MTYLSPLVHVDNSHGSDENIVHNGEGAFASDPVAGFVFNAGIAHDSSLVEADATVLNGPSERNLICVKVLPA